MTDFSPEDIPPDVNTIEKMYLWTSSILMDLYASKTSEESRGNPVRVVSMNPFFNDSSEFEQDWHWRVIVRVSMPVSSEWLRGGKILSFAQPLGNQAIPIEYLPTQETP